MEPFETFGGFASENNTQEEKTMANNYFETIPVVVFTREKLINDLYTYVNYEKIERELEESGAGSIKENKEFYAHRIASSIKALAPEATSAEELAIKLKSVL